MASFYNILIFSLILIQFNQINCKQFEFWGDLTPTDIYANVQEKYGIPFFKRTVQVTYPDVSFISFLMIE